MKKNKVILIGAINEGNNPSCGETMKNQLFVKRFNELFDEVITVDTLNWQKRPWILVKLFFTLLFNRGAKVIISASRSASYLISFLYFVPLKKNVYFWVVGGDLAIGVRNGIYNRKALKNVKYILVQGRTMVEELNKLGFYNVKYVPNSKPIDFRPSLIPKNESEPYRFVFLSRVHPNKGISEILEAAETLNLQGYEERFLIDFYGKIEKKYEEEFYKAIDTLNNVSYKGYLNLIETEGYQILSSYDVMLFPSYWSGEGFPGIVIDANIAGLPIIATDWNLNKEVIKDKETGFIIPIKDSLALKVAMKDIIDGKVNLNAMRNYCTIYVQQYDFRSVLSEELMREINLIN